MDPEDIVREHYSRHDLEATVLQALSASGADLDDLQIEDLAALDQLHAGFGPATEHLLEALQLGDGTALLDVGCGIGGPARLAAAGYGCRVTGIDLAPDFVELARSLTGRLRMSGSVTFDVGSAKDLPYDDGSFARAMLNHAGMNIDDKAQAFAEVRRVLAPDGLFAVYEQMRLSPGELSYPLPWADDQASSFVETRERYAELLVAAGFAVERNEDRTADVAAGGPPPAGALTPADLFGPGFKERMDNNIVAAMTGTLGAVLMVARAV